jgi:hypothetical protein
MRPKRGRVPSYTIQGELISPAFEVSSKIPRSSAGSYCSVPVSCLEALNNGSFV